MANVAPAKVKIVKELCKLFTEYPIVGAVNMENLPAPQLQKMKKKLKGKIILFMTKRRLMKIAIEKSQDKVPGLAELKKELVGMPALLFTKENPFLLYKTLKANKSKAPAKPGQIAPNDLIVPAGPTPFAPGPIIGELAMIGIKSGVENGKVAVKEDSVVAKAGEEIKAKAAEVLTRLGIKPMEVGLNLIATLEKGLIYKKDVLDIDEDQFMANLSGAGISATNLSVYIAYLTKDNIELVLSKAHKDAKDLGIGRAIIDKDMIDLLIGSANSHLSGLQSATNFETKVNELKGDAKVEEKKEEAKKPEPKPVEKKPEPKKEIQKAPESKPAVQAPKEVQKVEKKEVKPVEKKEVVKVEEKPVLKVEAKPDTKPVVKSEPKTEDKVADMVKKTKDFSAGKKVTADQLLNEVEKDKSKSQDKVPSAHELAKKKSAKKEDDVAELTKNLMSKGTLRK